MFEKLKEMFGIRKPRFGLGDKVRIVREDLNMFEVHGKVRQVGKKDERYTYVVELPQVGWTGEFFEDEVEKVE